MKREYDYINGPDLARHLRILARYLEKSKKMFKAKVQIDIAQQLKAGARRSKEGESGNL